MGGTADENELRRRYVDQRTSLDRLARELHCHRTTLERALSDAGIPIRRRGRPRRSLLEDKERLRKRYLVDGLSVEVLARELHVARKSLRAALAEAGIPRNKSGRRISHVILGDPTWLRQQYVDDGKSIRRIATELGVADESVRRALVRHDVPLRRRGGQLAAHRLLEQAGWLQMKLDQGYSRHAIARMLEVPPSTVYRVTKGMAAG